MFPTPDELRMVREAWERRHPPTLPLGPKRPRMNMEGTQKQQTQEATKDEPREEPRKDEPKKEEPKEEPKTEDSPTELQACKLEKQTSQDPLLGASGGGERAKWVPGVVWGRAGRPGKMRECSR